MTAGKYDLYIEKGTTFRRVFTVQDDDGALIDLTGYTARLQVRERASDEDPLDTWTEELTLSGPLGTITLLLSDTTTAAFEFTRGLYDLEIESGAGETTRLLEGTVTCSPEVTR